MRALLSLARIFFTTVLVAIAGLVFTYSRLDGGPARLRTDAEEEGGQPRFAPGFDAEPMHWRYDTWEAAATRLSFDVCDFDTVRAVRSVSFPTNAENAQYMAWKPCARLVTDPPAWPHDKFTVNVTAIIDSDWSAVTRGMADNDLLSKMSMSGYAELQSFRQGGNAELSDLARRLSQISSRRFSWARPLQALECCYGAEPSFVRLSMDASPRTWTFFVWLDPLVVDLSFVEKCARLPMNRTRSHSIDFLPIHQGNTLESLEYTLDRWFSIVLLCVWALVRIFDARVRSPLALAVVELYLCAYGHGLVASLAMALYVPRALTAALRQAACCISALADAALVFGVAAERLPRKIGGALLDSRGRLPGPRQPWPHTALVFAMAASALLPLGFSQVPPGFALCADGEDPIETPQGSIFIQVSRLLVSLVGLVAAVVALWRGGVAERPHFVSAMLFATAPGAASLLKMLVAHYAARKVQLAVSVMLCRTLGAVVLLADCSRAASDWHCPMLDMSIRPRWQRATLIALACAATALAASMVGLQVEASAQHANPWMSWHSACPTTTTTTEPQKRRHKRPPKAKPQAGNVADTAAIDSCLLNTTARVRKPRHRVGPLLDAANSAHERQKDGASAVVEDEQGANMSKSFADQIVDVEYFDDVRCDTSAGHFPRSVDGLHVVYACDEQQMPGLQASLASVVVTSATWRTVWLHVVVHDRSIPHFLSFFGLPSGCLQVKVMPSVFLQFHPVDTSMFQGAMAKVSAEVRNERGSLDLAENFARFYLSELLDAEIVIYLDADTIVQSDLGALQDWLNQSQLTVGFAARDAKAPVKLEAFMLRKEACNAYEEFILPREQLVKKDAYNAGVIAMNLRRWRQKNITARVERYVWLHNKCPNGLWKGGSQVPLLLSFLDRAPEVPRDFALFEPAWNLADLGWREGVQAEMIRESALLHWSGNRKPWTRLPLYREVWNRGCAAFQQLFGPSLGARLTLEGRLTPEELRRTAACPNVVLLHDLSKEPSNACQLGITFGCGRTSAEMWVNSTCQGIFAVSRMVTLCGNGENYTTCTQGALPTPEQRCGIMLLTSMFTMRPDWQRGVYIHPSFSKIKGFYETAMLQGVNVTVIYDELPNAVLRYEHPGFRFVKVDLRDFDQRLGLNDVRYFFFVRLIKEHPEWTTLFTTDLFDVQVKMNACPGVKPGKLYTIAEDDDLRGNSWMAARFGHLGGAYQAWFEQEVSPGVKILNCGIIGGVREMMLPFLERMLRVMSDPSLAIRKQTGATINVNMAALSYIVYNDFPGVQTSMLSRFGGFVVGPPVHSLYKNYEADRRDVWFVHK